MWNKRIVGYEDRNPRELIPNPRNWRTHPSHQANALSGVMKEVGVVQNVIFNVRTGRLVDGHLRVELAIKENQRSIPVTLVDLSESEEALILATIDPIAAQAGTDSEKLEELLASVKTDDESINQLIKTLANDEMLYWDSDTGQVSSIELKEKKKPLYHNPKVVDAIYTWSWNGDGCIEIALRAGLDYGIRSGSRAYPLKEPVFVDNKWENYDHEFHMKVVAQHRPKYCTVMDLLTKEHCEQLGIEYYDFDTIMRFAEEASIHAENVIVIPKYDCIADIPKEYMLGYSIPSSYGGTPLPFDKFLGHRIHLLGGSPKKQWEFYTQAPDWVVSVDTNYINKLATFGQSADFSFMAEEWNVEPDLLKNKYVHERLPLTLTNPYYVAFSISCGFYAYMWQRNGYTPPTNEIKETLEQLIEG